MACYRSGDFKKYFVENMNELGVAVPVGYFDTYQKAVLTATMLLVTLEKLGIGATIAELVGATSKLEKFLVLGGMGAVGYIGIVIGSIAVASGRSISCGSRIADMFVFVEQEKLTFKGWRSFYFHNPEIFDKSHFKRKTLALRVKSFPSSFEYV